LVARPEPTQLERLSDVSFLGKLLVLTTNVRLDWKVIDRYNNSSLFGLAISKEEKKFYKIDTRSVMVTNSGIVFRLPVDRTVQVNCNKRKSIL
jgi:hypothetical protein